MLYKLFAPINNVERTTQIHNFFNIYRTQFGIVTPKRIAAFLAQAAHESNNFNNLREIWDGKNAQARYEGRRDLGNIIVGDGKKFMGRGIFQVTGRANYEAISKKIFGNNRLVNNPEILEQPQYAVLSALHFWNGRNLNAYADKGDFIGLTKRINGGTNGLTDRKNKFAIVTKLFATNPAFAALFLVAEKKKSSSNFGSTILSLGSNFVSFFSGK